MKHISLSLLAAATLMLSAATFACDPKTEVRVDLRDEPARRIFEDLTKGEGWRIVNIDVLDGRNLTANFTACSMRETLDRLASSLGLALMTDKTELTFVTGTSDPRNMR